FSGSLYVANDLVNGLKPEALSQSLEVGELLRLQNLVIAFAQFEKLCIGPCSGRTIGTQAERGKDRPNITGPYLDQPGARLGPTAGLRPSVPQPAFVSVGQHIFEHDALHRPRSPVLRDALVSVLDHMAEVKAHVAPGQSDREMQSPGPTQRLLRWCISCIGLHCQFSRRPIDQLCNLCLIRPTFVLAVCQVSMMYQSHSPDGIAKLKVRLDRRPIGSSLRSCSPRDLAQRREPLCLLGEARASQHSQQFNLIL